MKRAKILFLIIIMIILIIFSYLPSYSFSVGELGGSTSGQEQQIEKFGQGIIKVISTVGSIISVIVLIIIGIKYMLGSVEEKATYKKSLLPYVIGACVVFAASNIASIIYNIAIKL